MPKQPRLDAPGTMHHIMGRGIEQTKVFRNKTDREDFLNRLAELCEEGALIDFVKSLLTEVDERKRETLRLRRKLINLVSLGRRIAEGEGLSESDLKSGNRNKRVSRTRRLLCQLAVGKMDYPAAEVARLLGVTTSAVVRATNSEDLPEIDKYI